MTILLAWLAIAGAQEGGEGNESEDDTQGQACRDEATTALQLRVCLAADRQRRAMDALIQVTADAASDKAEVRSAAKEKLQAAEDELDAAQRELRRAERGDAASLSAIERIYVSGDGSGSVTSAGVASAGAGLGVRLLSRLNRLSVRLGVATLGDVTGTLEGPEAFGGTVLDTASIGQSARLDYRFTLYTEGADGKWLNSFSSLQRRADAPGIVTIGAHITTQGGHSTWTLADDPTNPDVADIWIGQVSVLPSFEYNLGPLLKSQDLYFDFEAGYTLRAAAGDVEFARQALTGPASPARWGGDGKIPDTIVHGVEFRAAAGVNDGEFWLDVTWLGLAPETPVAPPDQIAGLTGWQLVAGATIYGDLFKVYDADGD